MTTRPVETIRLPITVVENPTPQEFAEATRNIPPPPPLDLPPLMSHEQKPPEAYKQITFADGKTLTIPIEWYNKYQKLQAPIILRDSRKFIYYCFPCLISQDLRMKYTDSNIEVTEFIDEVTYFEIELSEIQIQQLSDCCGFTKKLTKIKNFLDTKQRECIKIRFKRTLAEFSKLWDQYTSLLCLKYKNDSYKNINSALLLSQFDSQNDFYHIIRLNFLYRNHISQFIDMFEEFVIEKNKGRLRDMIQEISLSLPESDNLIDIGTNILGIVQNMGGVVTKGSVIKRISSLVNRQTIIKELQNNKI